MGTKIPTAGGLASLATDGTLTGLGTVASPLGVSQTAARGPGANGYWEAFFQQRTGFSPLNYVSYFNEFNEYSRNANQNTSAGQGISPSGTGASAAYNVTAGDGIITMTSQSTGTGNADWSPGGPSGDSMIINAKTKLWMVVYRYAVGTAPAAASRVSAGLFGGAKAWGLGYSGADTTFHYVFGTYAGGAIADVVDTGKAIDHTGTVYLWMYMASLDGINIVGTPDVVGGTAEANLDLVSNMPANVAAPYFANYGANSDVIQLDYAAAFCQR